MPPAMAQLWQGGPNDSRPCSGVDVQPTSAGMNAHPREKSVTYNYDPQLATVAATLPNLPFDDIHAAREAGRALYASLPAYAPPVPLRTEDVTVPGPEGADEVPVRVYSPAGVAESLPGLLFIHGGGFATGTLDSGDYLCSEVAAEVGAVVVSVDYRLAPEHPFPAGLEDCYAALRWFAASAADVGVDSSRIGVSGVSAGGGLAAALTLLTRDREGPALCFQLLNIPELDDRLETPSMQQYVDTPLWHRANAVLSWKYYLGAGVEPGGSEVSPYAAPARAADLAGLPSAFVMVCQFDPLRDEGIEYAQRLVQAGVRTELHLYAGTFHGSQLIREAAVSRRMRADELDELRRGLGAPGVVGIEA